MMLQTYLKLSDVCNDIFEKVFDNNRDIFEEIYDDGHAKDILEKVYDDGDDIFEEDSDEDKDILEEVFDDGDDIFESILMMLDILEKVSEDKRCFKCVSRLFQGCLKLVSWVFKVSFKDV